MTTVAVIGGGAAGIGAARTLVAEGLDVLMLEAAPRLGGNCLAGQVPAVGPLGPSQAIDIGVSDFNRTTFREFSRLIDELGLETRPISTDASFTAVDGTPVCRVIDGRFHFGSDFGDPEGFVAALDRFRVSCTEVLYDDRFADWSVERYLDHVGATDEFRSVYVYARAMGCFPMPDEHPKHYRIRDLIAFWNIHGVVGTAKADRHCVVGGMHRYVDAFRDWLIDRGGEVHCGTRVFGIARHGGGIEIRAVDRDDRHHRFRVSHVVLATTPHDALSLLEQPSPVEQRILRSFPIQRARVVVHQDPRLIGGDPACFGAFNYVVPSGRAPAVRPTITFFPNRLAGLPDTVPDTFVTMNPHLEPDHDHVITQRFFVHPIGGPANDRASASLQTIQGDQRTWYASSHLNNPFVHESAFVSGMTAACGVSRAVQASRRRAATPEAALI